MDIVVLSSTQPLPSLDRRVRPRFRGPPDYIMIPTSALRETIVLVIFGIVLVPIAAKRAQDAPGYWKAFAANAQQSLVYHDRQSQASAFMLTTPCDDAVSTNLPTEPYTVVGFTSFRDAITR